MISIILELELRSCAKMLALRQQYHQEGPIGIQIVRNLVYNRSNFDLLKRSLTELATTKAPFEMEFFQLHQTKGSGRSSVKFGLKSKNLLELRYHIQQHTTNARVFSKVSPLTKTMRMDPGAEVKTLGQDMALNPRTYNKPLGVTVKTRLGEAEANRIFEEVGKIDPKTLGRLKAIGLRMQWTQSTSSPYEKGKLIPFLRRSYGGIKRLNLNEEPQAESKLIVWRRPFESP